MTVQLEEDLKCLLGFAFLEDKASNDISTMACIDPSHLAKASIVLKQDATIAGLIFLPKIFHAMDPELNVQIYFQEGEKVPSGSTLATISGKASTILAAERTALNFLQHLCGIATITSSCVEEVEGLSCDILDTRKTLPGLRSFQKYAVRKAGGKNHRHHLAEQILIKKTHLSLLKEKHQNAVFEAVLRAKRSHPNAKVEVEVEDLNSLIQALDAKADLVLLDNMPIPMVEESVKLTKKKAYLETSGNMTKEKLRPYALTGIDGISIGALTHSVKAIDMSLRI